LLTGARARRRFGAARTVRVPRVAGTGVKSKLTTLGCTTEVPFNTTSMLAGV
jgi:hypothetical protein